MQLDLYTSSPEAGKSQPLSQFLTQRKVFITIDDTTEYKRCRVQSNRKGVVLRDLTKGAAINTKKQQLCRPGDFLVAEIDAKVGGYGFVPDALEGAIVSSHYYLFEVDESRLLPRYLHYLTQSDIIQRQISSQGSTNYAAIRPKEFLAIEIPYIEPDQQRDLISRLDVLTQEAEAFNQDTAHQATLLTHLRQAVLREAVKGYLVPQVATDEPAPTLLARIRAEKQRLVQEKKLRPDKPLPPLPETEVPYEVPQGWTWCRFGETNINRDGERRPLESSVRKGRQGPFDYYGASGVIDKIDSFLFDKPLLLIGEDGANLINRSTPIAFIADGKYWVNNHAHVVDAFDFITLKYLEIFFGSIKLDAYITGTAQPKLNQAKLNLIPTPLPPLPEQRRIVAKVTELLAHCTALEAELSRARQAAEALHAAALHEAFTEPAAVTVKAES